MVAGYSNRQIALHWLIAVLIPLQYLTGGSIERTHHAIHMGQQPAAWDIMQHHIHNYCGIAIGFLMALRLVVRFIDGVAYSGQITHWSVIAHVFHVAFYGVIIFQALLGFVASYLTFRVAPVHVIGSQVILAMVAVHFFAAAWHWCVLKDDSLDRIANLRFVRLKNKNIDLC